MVNFDIDVEEDQAWAEFMQGVLNTDEIFLKGGAGSGNRGHAGRPGQRGGSGEGDTTVSGIIQSPAKILEQAGLKVLTESEIPASLAIQINSHKRDFKPQDEAMGKGIVQALDTLSKKGFKDLSEEIKNTVKFSFLGYKPKEASMTSVTMHTDEPDKRYILVNLDARYDVETEKRDPGSYGAIESKKLYKETGDAKLSQIEDFRLSALHEFGHIYDAMHKGEMTRSFVETLYKMPNPEYFLKDKISSYATSSAKDAAAEAFSMMLVGKLPKELKAWGEKVHGLQS